jgi:hypothetical protein
MFQRSHNLFKVDCIERLKYFPDRAIELQSASLQQIGIGKLRATLGDRKSVSKKNGSRGSR